MSFIGALLVLFFDDSAPAPRTRLRIDFIYKMIPYSGLFVNKMRQYILKKRPSKAVWTGSKRARLRTAKDPALAHAAKNAAVLEKSVCQAP
ncbi:MAG: hypothetical protein IKS90_04440 [Clostridia bacterium]|nr:hypothetical protein [Clostridia bacterium]